jgi:hypothetical protein
LRVIGSGVAKGDVIFVTKVYHLLGFKSSCIISNELLGASKYGKILFSRNEIMTTVCGLSRRDGFYPFGESNQWLVKIHLCWAEEAG